MSVANFALVTVIGLSMGVSAMDTKYTKRKNCVTIYEIRIIAPLLSIRYPLILAKNLIFKSLLLNTRHGYLDFWDKTVAVRPV